MPTSAHRRLLQHGVMVKARGMQMAITRAAAFDTDVAGRQRQKASIARTLACAVDMTLRPVTNQTVAGNRRRKLFRQLAEPTSADGPQISAAHSTVTLLRRWKLNSDGREHRC